MTFLAQLGAEIAPFAQYGLLGAIVAWMATRVEKRLDRMEHTMKGLSMALLMDLSTRKVLGSAAQRMVDDMLAKMGYARDSE